MNKVFLVSLFFLLSGCSGISKENFEKNPSLANNYSICKTLSQGINDLVFQRNLEVELNSRGLDLSSCEEIIKEHNKKIVDGISTGIAILAFAAVAAHASSGSGSSGRSLVDTDWAWDQFYNNGSLVWACRGVQTGEFAELEQCQYKYKNDFKWPSKNL